MINSRPQSQKVKLIPEHPKPLGHNCYKNLASIVSVTFFREPRDIRYKTYNRMKAIFILMPVRAS